VSVDWLKSAALILGGWLLMALAGEMLRPVLRPVGRLYTRAYAPPHGLFVLFSTYGLAFVVIRTAFRIEAARPGLSVTLLLGAALAALIGTLVFRDERRSASGLPPVRANIPSSVGFLARAGLLLASLAFAGMAIGLIAADDAIFLEPIIALSAGALACGLVAMTGRVPWLLRASLGAGDAQDTPAPPENS
jgi:hypothetical protein